MCVCVFCVLRTSKRCASQLQMLFKHTHHGIAHKIHCPLHKKTKTPKHRKPVTERTNQSSRSPTSPTSWNDEESRPISPISTVQMGGKLPGGGGGGSFLDGPIASTSAESAAVGQQQANAFAKSASFDMQSATAAQPHPHMHHHHHHHPSGLLVTALDGPEAMGADDTASYKGGHAGGTNDHNEGEQQQHHAGGGGPLGAGNGGETETKSISSFKSIGSTADRYCISPHTYTNNLPPMLPEFGQTNTHTHYRNSEHSSLLFYRSCFGFCITPNFVTVL